MTREKLRSDLASAISIANETELSIDFVTRGQVTRNFAAGHFRYLANQLHDSTKELADSTPERGLEQSLTGSREQVNALASTLQVIASEIDRTETLTASKKRVDTVRRALEHETSTL